MNPHHEAFARIDFTARPDIAAAVTDLSNTANGALSVLGSNISNETAVHAARSGLGRAAMFAVMGAWPLDVFYTVQRIFSFLAHEQGCARLEADGHLTPVIALPAAPPPPPPESR